MRPVSTLPTDTPARTEKIIKLAVCPRSNGPEAICRMEFACVLLTLIEMPANTNTTGNAQDHGTNAASKTRQP